MANCLYRLLGQDTLAFPVGLIVVQVVADMSVYGLLLVVVGRVCFKGGTRRIVHAAGFLVIVPSLLTTLRAATADFGGRPANSGLA